MDMTLVWLRKKRVWAGLVIASFIAVLITQLPLLTWLAETHRWLESQGIWALPAFIAVYIIVAIFGLPNIVLILAAGPLFGLVEGVVSASIADTLSIAACFVIGQKMGRRWITSVVTENSRFHRLDRAFAQKGWKIVLLTRLSPLLPSSVLNYGFSLTRINFWEYLFFSWLGMLPVIFAYVYVSTFGANILAPNQNSEHLSFQTLGLVATVGVMFYTTKLATSALRSEETCSVNEADVLVTNPNELATDCSQQPATRSEQIALTEASIKR
ncbi:MAG: TVP38/TMEM64 family protein [Phormidesmis sp.]